MPRKNAPHNESNRLSAMDNRAKALDLRRAGASLRDIAKALGVSHQSAKRYIDTAIADLQESQDGKAEDYRAVELDRLERLHMALWPVATGKETAPETRNKAIDRLVRISERRSKLLGLDAPQKQELTGADGSPLIPKTVRVVYDDPDTE